MKVTFYIHRKKYDSISLRSKIPHVRFKRMLVMNLYCKVGISVRPPATICQEILPFEVNVASSVKIMRPIKKGCSSTICLNDRAKFKLSIMNHFLQCENEIWFVCMVFISYYPYLHYFVSMSSLWHFCKFYDRRHYFLAPCPHWQPVFSVSFFINIILNTSISLEFNYYFSNWLINISIRMSIVNNKCWFSNILSQFKQFQCFLHKLTTLPFLCILTNISCQRILYYM